MSTTSLDIDIDSVFEQAGLFVDRHDWNALSTHRKAVQQLYISADGEFPGWLLDYEHQDDEEIGLDQLFQQWDLLTPISEPPILLDESFDGMIAPAFTGAEEDDNTSILCYGQSAATSGCQQTFIASNTSPVAAPSFDETDATVRPHYLPAPLEPPPPPPAPMPIPDDVQAIVDYISHNGRERNGGGPGGLSRNKIRRDKCLQRVISRKTGLVKLQCVLRPFVGDTRLFDDATWRWLTALPASEGKSKTSPPAKRSAEEAGLDELETPHDSPVELEHTLSVSRCKKVKKG